MKKIIISLLLLTCFSAEAQQPAPNVYCQTFANGNVICTDGVNRWIVRRGV